MQRSACFRVVAPCFQMRPGLVLFDRPAMPLGPRTPLLERVLVRLRHTHEKKKKKKKTWTLSEAQAGGRGLSRGRRRGICSRRGSCGAWEGAGGWAARRGVLATGVPLSLGSIVSVTADRTRSLWSRGGAAVAPRVCLRLAPERSEHPLCCRSPQLRGKRSTRACAPTKRPAFAFLVCFGCW